MSPERTRAYRQVVKTLKELGPSKLQVEEQDCIRNAADNLIFSSDLNQDVAAQAALDDVGNLCRDLVESGRWEPVTAERLAADIGRCGPARHAELEAA